MEFLVALALHFLVLGTVMAMNSGDGGEAKNNRELQDPGIQLAGILDTISFDWAETIFEITIDLLNDKNNGFFDEELESLGPITYQVLNTDCDAFTALSAYWDVRFVDAVIGARCSGASTPLAWMGALDNKPQISMSSTSARLSDKSQFPNFSRLVAPDDERGQVGALIQTMDLFGWDRVTIINTDTSFAKDLATSFLESWEGDVAYSATVTIKDGLIDEGSLIKVLREAPLDDPANNSKVVVLFAHDEHAFPILRSAQDIFPTETFYVGPESWAGRLPSTENWIPHVPGYLGVAPYRNRYSIAYQNFVRLAGDRLKPILNSDWMLPDYAADNTVDSIVAMVLALAITPIGSRSSGAIVTENLRKLDFDGISGRVRFTVDGDRLNPEFDILNFRQVAPYNTTKSNTELNRPSISRYKWASVGSTGTEPGSASFSSGIQNVCFAGLGCGLDSAPNDSPPVPPDKIAIWVPVVIVFLCAVFLLTFYLYRRKKIQASRKTKAVLAAKEAELDAFRNSVVDMCTAEEQYVPSITSTGCSNGAVQIRRIQWCWKETDSQMANWDDAYIEGNRLDCWIKYEDYASTMLELAYQEQGHRGSCKLSVDYSVSFDAMIQTKWPTNFKREVKRIEDSMQDQALDLSKIVVAKGRPDDISKEPQMVLVPGDIVQISKKRNDGWAYGSKLHMEDEPLGRRLALVALSGQDNISDNGDGDDDLITSKHGWFPTEVTRVPNTDDLAILRKTLGEADDLSAPKSWDKIVDPSVVQKSKPLDKHSKEYIDVASAFITTLPDQLKIVRIQRIQNTAMWQSYVVKRKTVIDRDKSFGGASGLKQSLARFERRWLWHGTNADSVEKIIQQGFNRSFCGKNATMYGKGVYFARDASYSSSNTYSPPNSSGEKFILACSVVVGEFCRGKMDARTPELRDAAKNVLYDCTVDNPSHPSLYVTYHDAQAYPEYLIAFKEKRKSMIS